MRQSYRNLAAIFAALLVSFTLAGIVRAAEGDADKEKLETIAKTVASVAKESIIAAKDDADAAKRAQASFDALRSLGELGGFDTQPMADKLMDDLMNSPQAAVISTVVQKQFMSKIMTWQTMSQAEKEAVLDRFVSDVKKVGLTPDMAAALSMLLGRFGEMDQSKIISKAVTEVLPHAKKSGDPKMDRKIDMLAGIDRRMNLVGKPFKLEGKLLDGSTFDWATYKGKVVLIDFYASWCGPCKAEAPNVLKHYKAYHDKGFEVVTVNLDVDPKLAEKYINETGCDFPTIYSEDPKGWETPMATYYGVNAIPRVILVDQDGNVVSTNARGGELTKQLTKLIGPPPEGSDVAEDAAKAAAAPAAGGGDREAAKAAILERLKKAQEARKQNAEKN